MKNRIKWRVNIFDIIIIVIVIAAAAAFLIFKDIKSPDDISAGDSTDICYTITFSNMSEGMGEFISVGDELIDSVRGYKLGTAEAVEVTPAIVYTEDVLAGEIRETENPEHEDIIITVVAEGTETDTALIVDGGYKLKAGNPISIKGAGYAISGYITHIERS